MFATGRAFMLQCRDVRYEKFLVSVYRKHYTGNTSYRFFTSCKVALNWFLKTIKKFETIL